MKKLWNIQVSQNRFEYTGTIQVEAKTLTWDWSNENKREMWMNEDGVVGDVLIADGVRFTVDESFLEPELIDHQGKD